MIPLRDNEAARRLASATVLLIVVNLAVFAYEIHFAARGGIDLAHYAMVPAIIAGAHPLDREPGVLATLVTSTFLHAGLLHIAGNMLYLLIFGPAVEERMGHLRFIIFYLLAGVVAGLTTVVMGPGSWIPVIGASGAIGGVLGAYFVLFPRGRITTIWFFRLIEIPAIFYLLVWFALQLYSGMPDYASELRLDQVEGYDAVVVLGPRVTSSTLDGAERLALIARFGVGYDGVDVEACTRNDVILTTTPDGVRRPMATAILTLLLALSQRLLVKDRMTRAGQGWERKLDAMGTGLTGRTLGIIGFGNIGREVFRLAQPFEMRHLAHDPYWSAVDAAALEVEMVGLETLLRTADYVAICCALTPETHHLINAERLALMKSEAYLINGARGAIVDQAALTAALRAGQIQGAALDVFEREPIDPDDPLLSLDNVILTPHGLCWTDEFAAGVGGSVIDAIRALAAGTVPAHVVNRDVLSRPRLQRKLDHIRERATSQMNR